MSKRWTGKSVTVVPHDTEESLCKQLLEELVEIIYAGLCQQAQSESETNLLSQEYERTGTDG